MSKELALVPSTEELNAYLTVAKSAAATPYWTKMGGESALLSVMLMGRELGIAPMNAISGMFHVIQGKVELSARAINYLIRKAGHTLQLKQLTKDRCVLYGKRKDTGEDMEVEYTLEEARRAGLVKSGGGWEKHPTDMLWSRSISRIGRWLFPDVLGTSYAEGELQETIQKKPQVTPEKCDMEVEVIKMELDKPSGVTEKEIDEYLEELESIYEKPKSVLYSAALANPTKFWASFEEWKKASSSEEVVQEVDEVFV